MAVLALAAVGACGWEQARPPSPAPPSAGGEMCEEHGVLEAVCTRCNPTLIPVFQAKGDWCPEHGFPLSFCPVHHPERGGRPVEDTSADGAPADGRKVRFARRETARLAGLVVVPAAAAPDRGGVEAVARIVWDGTRHAIVTGRGPGVVQVVKADVGAWVEAGSPLAVVGSTRSSADRSALAAAEARLALTEEAIARSRGLESVVSDREIKEREQDVVDAQAAVAAARVAQGYTLSSPLAGVVTAREVTVGMAIDAGRPAFEVVDPRSLWAEIDVPDDELPLVLPGHLATVTVDGVDERSWTGAVHYVAPLIDPVTRTGLVRVALDNADGALRANMYGSARIAVGGEREAVAVPAAAVQRAKDVDVVFVQLAEDEFETRRVKVVARQGDTVWLARGVRAGEPVVTEGSFLLKTETLEDSIGAGCCDVE